MVPHRSWHRTPPTSTLSNPVHTHSVFFCSLAQQCVIPVISQAWLSASGMRQTLCCHDFVLKNYKWTIGASIQIEIQASVLLDFPSILHQITVIPRLSPPVWSVQWCSRLLPQSPAGNMARWQHPKLQRLRFIFVKLMDVAPHCPFLFTSYGCTDVQTNRSDNLWGLVQPSNRDIKHSQTRKHWRGCK